jgi:iron(III) transport system permease protein
MEEVAQVSGAGWRQIVSRVSLPLLTPALLSSFIYAFMINLESLEIPMVVGLPAKIYVFSSYIFFASQRSAPPDYGLSAALGSTFLVASLALVFWYRRVVRQADRFATVTGKGYRPRVTPLGPWRYAAFAAFVLYFLLTTALPALVLFWRSIVPFFVPPSLAALSTVTFDHYRTLFAVDALPTATLNTLVVGLATATLGMLLSLIIAWVVVRSRSRVTGLLDGLTFLPNAIPGVIIGVALIYTYIQPPLRYVPIYGTVAVIVLGLITSYLAFGTRQMNGAVVQIHRELEDAAQTSGASRTQVLLRVILPLLFPAFISGWIWVIAHAMRSFSIPLMLQTTSNQVLAVQLWYLWDKGEAGPASGLGLLLILSLGAMTLVGRWLVSRTSRQE